MCRTLWKRKWSILTVLLFQTRLCLLSAIQHKFTAKKYKYHIPILVRMKQRNTILVILDISAFNIIATDDDLIKLICYVAMHVLRAKHAISLFFLFLWKIVIYIFTKKHSLIFYPKISFLPSFANLNVWSEKCGDTRAQKQ